MSTSLDHDNIKVSNASLPQLIKHNQLLSESSASPKIQPMTTQSEHNNIVVHKSALSVQDRARLRKEAYKNQHFSASASHKRKKGPRTSSESSDVRQLPTPSYVGDVGPLGNNPDENNNPATFETDSSDDKDIAARKEDDSEPVETQQPYVPVENKEYRIYSSIDKRRFGNFWFILVLVIIVVATVALIAASFTSHDVLFMVIAVVTPFFWSCIACAFVWWYMYTGLSRSVYPMPDGSDPKMLFMVSTSRLTYMETCCRRVFRQLIHERYKDNVEMDWFVTPLCPDGWYNHFRRVTLDSYVVERIISAVNVSCVSSVTNPELVLSAINNACIVDSQLAHMRQSFSMKKWSDYKQVALQELRQVAYEEYAALGKPMGVVRAPIGVRV